MLHLACRQWLESNVATSLARFWFFDYMLCCWGSNPIKKLKNVSDVMKRLIFSMGCNTLGYLTISLSGNVNSIDNP